MHHLDVNLARKGAFTCQASTSRHNPREPRRVNLLRPMLAMLGLAAVAVIAKLAGI